MQAIEFQTTVHEGIIEIPPQYRNQIKEHVRVIVLSDEQDSEHSSNPGQFSRFLASPIPIHSLEPWNRDKLHER